MTTIKGSKMSYESYAQAESLGLVMMKVTRPNRSGRVKVVGRFRRTRKTAWQAVESDPVAPDEASDCQEAFKKALLYALNGSAQEILDDKPMVARDRGLKIEASIIRTEVGMETALEGMSSALGLLRGSTEKDALVKADIEVQENLVERIEELTEDVRQYKQLKYS